METEKRSLMVELTEEEIAVKAAAMSKCIIAIRPLIKQRKLINDDIKELEEQVEILADVINGGQEQREVECFWRYEWTKNVRHLMAPWGEIIDTEMIPPGKKQVELFETPAFGKGYEKAEVGMFAGCPENEGGCAFFKSGNKCAPILCGKNLPALGGECDHPESERVVESNATSCGICKAVLQAAEITRESQPAPEEKKRKRGKKKAAEPENASVVGGDGAPGDGDGRRPFGRFIEVCMDVLRDAVDDELVQEDSGEGIGEGEVDVCEGCDIVDGGCASAKLCASDTSDNWRELADGGCEEIAPECDCGEQEYCNICCPPSEPGFIPVPVVSFDEGTPPNMTKITVPGVRYESLDDVPFVTTGQPEKGWLKVPALESCEHGKGLLERCDECKRFTHTFPPGRCAELAAKPATVYVIGEPPPKDRKCCFPHDRDIHVEGDTRYLYCRECGVVHKVEDTSVDPWVSVPVAKYAFVDLKVIRGAKG